MFTYKNIVLLFGLLSVSTLALHAQIQFNEATALKLNPQEYYTAPTPSPDGNYLAISTMKYTGIQLLNLSTNEVKTIDESEASGWRMKWSPSSSALIFRGSQINSANRKEHALQVYDLATATKTPFTDWNQQAPGLPVFSIDADEAVFFEKATTTNARANAVVTIDITSSKKAVNAGLSEGSVAYQFADATVYELSKNGAKKAVYSNANGYPILDIHAYKDQFIIIEEVGSPLLRKNLSTGQIDELAEGEEATISPDGKYLVFRYSMDDGHNYIYSELVLMDLSSKEVLDRYSSSEIMPFSPAWKADGSGLFFADRVNGRIYELSVQEVK